MKRKFRLFLNTHYTHRREFRYCVFAYINIYLVDISHKMWKEEKRLCEVIWYIDMLPYERKMCQWTEKSCGAMSMNEIIISLKVGYTFGFCFTAIFEKLRCEIVNRSHNTSPLNSLFVINAIPWIWTRS